VLTAAEATQLQTAMFGRGKLAADFIAQPAGAIARRAGLTRPALFDARMLIVEETGVGSAHPFSGEKMSPVLAFYRCPISTPRPHLPSASCGIRARAIRLAAQPTAGRVLAIGPDASRLSRDRQSGALLRTGGSFDNALPFSLSMGCGTWGGNSISDNLNYRHFLNITRVVHPLRSDHVREPSVEELFGDYRRKHGA
jgi:sulfoacetaldehyde dehydrogenase